MEPRCRYSSTGVQVAGASPPGSGGIVGGAVARPWPTHPPVGGEPSGGAGTLASAPSWLATAGGRPPVPFSLGVVRKCVPFKLFAPSSGAG